MTATEPGEQTVLYTRSMTSTWRDYTIEQAIGRVPGVTRARIDFAQGTVTINHDPDVVSTESLVQAMAELGYPARPLTF